MATLISRFRLWLAVRLFMAAISVAPAGFAAEERYGDPD